MNTCILCQHPSLHPVFKNQTGVSVSSDNKVVTKGFTVLQCQKCGHLQKKIDDIWQTGIGEIYQQYDPYHLSNGKEESYYHSHLNIDPRSEWIYQQIKPRLSESTMQWLDIGAGNGAFIRTVAQYRPHDQFYAQDLHSHHQATLEKIPGFQGFYQGELCNINQNFDVISLIHVLEHVLNPIEFLSSIIPLMHHQTQLIIQVPNIEGSYHDVFTYDHLSHFFPNRLKALLDTLFQQVTYTPFKYQREMLFICQQPKKQSTPSIKFFSNSAQWQALEQSIQKVLQLKQHQIPAYLFGTAPPSLFWGHLLKSQLIGYLDDNEMKQGQLLDDRPILSRQEITDKATPIFISLGKGMSQAITQSAPELNWQIL